MSILIGELYNELNRALSNLLKPEELSSFEREIPVSQKSPHYSLINALKKILLALYKDNSAIQVKSLLDSEIYWTLKRRYPQNDVECQRLAIIMYFTIGFDNSRDLILGKYGPVDYEMLSYLFADFDIIRADNDIKVAYFDKDEKSIMAFKDFLFGNKKDQNNNMRLILNGDLLDIFVNFDYFFNSIDYFIAELGVSLNRNRLITLLKERYVARRLESPELNGDILEDMISSYKNRYDIDENDESIINKNVAAYQEKLKTKTKSSIKKVDIPKIENYSFEMIPLSDARNLVMGYRAGNCFRLNGEAFVLFNNFLTNPHMRLLSISTDEYKDFGMVLLMRNGNVLIAQGIETSRRVPINILGEKLYLAVQSACEYIMNKMNEEDDEIVASIIGLTNANTSPYNQCRLPFIVNPILDNNHQYYNGIDSYQGLLSIKDGKTINSFKLFTPSKLYEENENTIWRRDRNTLHTSYEYTIISKILLSLRYAKFESAPREEMIYYYDDLSRKREIYTVCTRDWFIMLFQDGTIDSFVNSDDPIITKDYYSELSKIKKSFKSFN